MGHHTEIVDISPRDAVQLQGQAQSNSGRSLENALMDFAMDQWRAGGGHGDIRNGTPEMLTTRSSGQVHHLTDDESWVNDSRSIIVPIAAECDVIITQREIVVGVAAQALKYTRPAHKAAHLLPPLLRGGLGRINKVTPVKLRKPVAKATEGKLVTEYYLVDHLGVPAERLRSGEPTTYESLAAARAAGIKLLEERPSSLELEVRARSARHSSEGRSLALATISRPETDVRITIDFEEHIVKPGAQPERYMVMFDVHT